MAKEFIISIITNSLVYSNSATYASAGTELFGITAGSMSCEQILCSEEFELGSYNATKFEVQLFNLQVDVTGAILSVSCLEDGTWSALSFLGRIDSSTKDKDNFHRDIVAYDSLYYVRDKDIASAWNGSSIWPSTSAVSLKTIRENLCEYVGLSLDSNQPALPNDNVTFLPQFTSISSASFSTILKMICELQACFPVVVNGGILRFIQLGTVATPIDNLYDTNETNFEDYNTKCIDGINVYSTSSTLVQTVRYQGTNPTNLYNISGNIFILSLDSVGITAYVGNVLNAIKNISYNPASITMIESDWSFSLGQKLTTTRNGVTYTHYVFANSLSSNQLVMQSIQCPAHGDSRDSNVKSANNSIIADQKYSELKQDIDEIEIKVGSKNKIWKQNSVPSSSLATVGDLWFVTGSTPPTGFTLGKWYYYVANDAWEETTDSTITEHTATLTTHSTEIAARVTKTGGTAQSFAWTLTENGFTLTCNNDVVFSATPSYTNISGSVFIGGYHLLTDLAGTTDTVDTWKASDDATKIDGGHIYAGSVTATEIDATNLHVSSANIDGTITANALVIKDTSNRNLFDASGNTVNIGYFTVKRNASSGALYSGPTSLSSTSTAGVYIGTDGVLVSAGSGVTGNPFVRLTASTGLIEANNIQASGGSVGGWIIGDGRLSSTTHGGYVYLSSSADFTANASSPIGTMAGGAVSNLCLAIGANASNRTFGVGVDGRFYATSGYVGGWQITASKLYAPHSSGNDGIGMYKSGGSATQSLWQNTTSPVVFYAGASSDTPVPTTSGSCYFAVLQDGSIYANAAKISGNIQATSGSFSSGCTLGPNMSIGTWQTYYTALYSGNAINISNPFTIPSSSTTGSMYCTDATGSNGGFITFRSLLYASWFNSSTVRIIDEDGSSISLGINNPRISWYRTNNTDSTTSAISASPVYMYWDSDSYIYMGGTSGHTVASANLISYTSSGSTPGGGKLQGTWYQKDGNAITSDRDAKHDITDMAEKYSAFFDELRPRTFKYNHGTSNRTHIGFIAQEIEEISSKTDVTTDDTGIFVRHTYNEPEVNESGEETMVTKTECCLRYDEIIALNTWQIQKLKARIAELERKLEQ